MVAQGAKLCRIGAREFHYDASSYLVFTGETEFTSAVVDASRERPYLSMILQLPAEDVVRTPVSLGDGAGGDAPPPDHETSRTTA